MNKNKFTLFGARWASLALVASLFASYSYASSHAEILRVYQGGDLMQTLRLIDITVSRDGKEPKLLLLKGTILAQQRKDREAVVFFQDLVKEFPHMPELYNNLAVLYAKQGQIDLARELLEQAFKTHPTYATAHANLVGLSALMAELAYSRALNPEARNPPRQSAELKFVDPIDVISPAPALSEPAPALSEPAPALSEPAEDSHQEVLAALEHWRAAWSAGQVDRYIQAYHPSFRGGSRSRQHWVQERTNLIRSKRSIQVEVNVPTIVSSSSNRVLVRFYQVFRSDRLNSRTNKTVTFERVNGRWLIVREEV